MKRFLRALEEWAPPILFAAAIIVGALCAGKLVDIVERQWQCGCRCHQRP
jgi:hypothetical protein